MRERISRLTDNIQKLQVHTAVQIEGQSNAVGSLRGMLNALEDSSQMTEGTSRRTKTIADTLTGLTRRG